MCILAVVLELVIKVNAGNNNGPERNDKHNVMRDKWADVHELERQIIENRPLTEAKTKGYTTKEISGCKRHKKSTSLGGKK